MDSHESRRKLSDLILQLEFQVKFVFPHLFVSLVFFSPSCKDMINLNDDAGFI